VKPSRSRRTKAGRAAANPSSVLTLAERRPHLAAAPPDAAGHQGDFTAPDELLTIETTARQCPALHTDSTHARPIIRDPGVALLIVAGVAILTVVLFGVYLP